MTAAELDRYAAYLDASSLLAREFGQGIRREGRVYIVPSRTRSGLEHRVAHALDGALICNCEAAAFGRECWAVAYIREELAMQPTTTALTPVELIPPQSLLPTERTYALIDRAAQLALSGAVALPRELNAKDKVAAVMLYGWELGLKPMTALQELYIVNGRVQPSARVMAGLLHSRTDARIQVVEATDKRCTLRLVWPSRHVDEQYTVEWSEIERAKLANRDVWATYPRDKLITHTTKRILRIYAPDIINGLIGPAFVQAEDEEEPVEDDELYNPGDHPRVIDHETGEIIEGATQETPVTARDGEVTASASSPSPASPPASITDEQRKALTKALQDVAGTWDKASVEALYRDTLRQRWPRAFLPNMNRLSALTEDEAAEVLRYLTGTPDEGDEPPPEVYEQAATREQGVML